MTKWILLIAALVAAYILWPKSELGFESAETNSQINLSKQNPIAAQPLTKTSTKASAPEPAPQANTNTQEIPSAPEQLITGSAKSKRLSEEKSSRFRSYTVNGGLAVFDGDIVLGRLHEGSPLAGKAELPQMKLWPTREIPVFIQPSVPDPERIQEALILFSSTVLKFVPYTDQEDVLVFENGTGDCKSYVGMIGGKQPVWVPKNCGPTEIAHEIMHALGFIHEQNRDDRDQFIQVQFENINESAAGNFEKLPSDFMEVSGNANFAFKSIMIYPPTMFSKTGELTMLSKVQGEAIEPGRHLSSEDISRINIIYGRR